MPDDHRNSRDYFAELYVAGILGDAGWSIYFPKRDVGFDFIISKEVRGSVILRPVQVKGKYPNEGRRDRPIYGYIGRLSLLHDEMVLAIPFFPIDRTGVAPTCIAYLPRWQIRTQQGRGYACRPAQFKNGVATPRRDFRRYFGSDGIRFMETEGWSQRSDPKAR